MDKDKFDKGKRIMQGLTTLTAIIHALSIFIILGLSVSSAIYNKVYLLEFGVILFLINIPIWNLGTRADKWWRSSNT